MRCRYRHQQEKKKKGLSCSPRDSQEDCKNGTSFLGNIRDPGSLVIEGASGKGVFCPGNSVASVPYMRREETKCSENLKSSYCGKDMVGGSHIADDEDLQGEDGRRES